MTTATAEFVPLNDFAIGGGGLIDDCDAKLTRVRFVTKTDLGGKPLEKPSLYLEVDYAVVGEQARTDWYSAGTIDRFKPTPDGAGVVQVGTANRLKADCNAAIFLAAAMAADSSLTFGPPKGVAVLEGRMAHLKRVKQPDRGGVGRKNATLLVIAHFIASSKAQAASAAPAEADADIEEMAVDAVRALVAKTPEVTKTKASSLLFAQLEGHPQRKAIMSLALEPGFLKQEGLGWTFDGKHLRAAE